MNGILIVFYHLLWGSYRELAKCRPSSAISTLILFYRLAKNMHILWLKALTVIGWGISLMSLAQLWSLWGVPLNDIQQDVSILGYDISPFLMIHRITLRLENFRKHTSLATAVLYDRKDNSRIWSYNRKVYIIIT